ncbi:histidine decarboxylase [Silvanigrella aquatica]|uniref:Histidine decarboxylase n=1 Tax=Silvanigrella aquatica TaxID=1915309 RepID=A0A1L4D3L7_9BACT|nr:histidine decarboxylase [Silvanigrella aquatica]APJ04803.1 hypothetical protein AXG55_13200 [Silvanigrella aquatica]
MNAQIFENYESILSDKYKELQKNSKYMIGYPVNEKFNYSILNKFFELSLNNAGDPFNNSNYKLNTHEFESEVVSFIANLYYKNENFWGYITNGGTEGNLFGLHVGRLCYPDGIVYYSEHSHYSIPKAVSITRSQFESIPVLENGELNYNILEEKIHSHSKKPVIIMANLGTTMTGAIDNLEKIKCILERNRVSKYYIHCDAAFHGLILPFCEMDKPIKLDEIHSISISGHKFIGSPIPCGVFLTHQSIMNDIKNFIEYIKSSDSTLTGSRNAITPLILWCAIQQHSHLKLKHIVEESLEKAKYTRDKMVNNGINAWINQYSPIVVFPRPKDDVIKKWTLAPYNEIAHMITLPHVSYKVIDNFIEDLLL